MQPDVLTKSFTIPQDEFSKAMINELSLRNLSAVKKTAQYRVPVQFTVVHWELIEESDFVAHFQTDMMPNTLLMEVEQKQGRLVHRSGRWQCTGSGL